jgi:hypothetical protein
LHHLVKKTKTKMMKTPTTPKKKTLNLCNARNLLQRKAWNENQLLLKPTKQNYLQQQKQLCSQNGFSGLNILCCFAI